MSVLQRGFDELVRHAVVRDDELSWFGERRVNLSGIDESVRVEVVAAHLYQHWYTVGRPVVASPGGDITRDLQPDFDAILAGHLEWFQGWEVARDHGERDGVVVTDGSIALTAARSDIRVSHSGAELRVPLARRRLSPGFYLIPATRPLDRTRLVRAYVSVRPEGAGALLSSFLDVRDRFNAQAKVLSSRGSYARLDSFVCYFDRDDLGEVLAWLGDPGAGFAPQLRASSPALTHPVGAGVAVAAEPSGSGSSFGTTVTSALAAALLGNDVGLARDRLAAAGLDPEDPAHRLGDADYPRRWSARPSPAMRHEGAPVRVVSDIPTDIPTGIDVDTDAIAGQIADLLCDEAIRHRGCATWLATPPPLPFVTDRRPVGGTVGPDLYSGTAGIGGFLLRAASLGDNHRWSAIGCEAVAHTVDRLRHGWRAPGWYTGSAGAALAVLRLGKELAEEGAAQSAREVLLEAPDPSWSSPDLLSGVAGSLLAAVRAAEETDDAVFLDAGVAWADLLLDLAGDVRRTGWPEDGTALTGLSHGAAGIAHALEAWGRASGDRRVDRLIEETLAWEDALFDEQRRNWPDLRPQLGATSDPDHVSHVSYWCHGAPGIMLARQRSARSMPAGLDLWATVAESLDGWHGAADPALCHGLAGLADVATLVHGRDRSVIDRVVVQVAAWGPVSDWPVARAGSFRPSLMLGLAGIGDWLLRLRDPAARSPLDP